MKISHVCICGIKSHLSTTCNLEDYNSIVGENNSGKSNFLFALRWFFSDIKLSINDVNYFYQEDPSVKLEFVLEANEDLPDGLEDKDIYYKDGQETSEDRIFTIEAFIDQNSLKNKDSFANYRLIRKGGETKPLKKSIRFAEVIYIPSVKILSDEFKFTASSTINKLVSKYVIDRIKSEDKKSEHYKNIKKAFEELSSYISTGETSAFEALRHSLLKYMLDYPNIELRFKLQPPRVDELIKGSFKAFTTIEGSDKELELDAQGMGYQRSLIFSLLCNLADLNYKDGTYTLYLIEEPELFLHPNHQNHFKDKLKFLSEQSNNQIILNSHSPYYLCNISNYSQIKRISILQGVSELKEMSHHQLLEICNKNGQLMAEAYNECKQNRFSLTELEIEANNIAIQDEIRYLLWVDPNRANCFLSKKVLLVEGSTEKAFFSYIFNHEKEKFESCSKIADIMILDVNGKYHFYKFANLLNALGINTWIIFDKDTNSLNNRISHEKLNEIVTNLKEDNIIIDCLALDPNLENYIGLSKDQYKPDVSLYHKLITNEKDCKDSSGFATIIEFTNNILNY
jgi:predicted ATP-dependent endonuclease of OLD family